MDITVSFPRLGINVNKELIENIHSSANQLFQGMVSLNTSKLNISEYNHVYLKNHLENLPGTLQKFAYILGGCLAANNKPLSDVCLIEYGGGTGMLSILAKKTGIGNVIYNDIYDVSCRDAEVIATALGCRADHYIEGNIDDLITFGTRHGIKCDSMGSNDVIEHIYDIDDFLGKLRFLSTPNTVMFHATGANMFFYPYVLETRRSQRKDETRGNPGKFGWKQRDCMAAFYEEREKIIRAYLPGLREGEINSLARNTRGLIQKDILHAVDSYVRTGSLPHMIEHPTNTCDPYTGNWSEHLMNPYYLEETLTSYGFEVKILPLPWRTSSRKPLRRVAARLLNMMTRISNESLYFAPGYAVYAQYNGTFPPNQHKRHIYKT